MQNVAVGGQFGMLASAEYMFPITADDMLRGVVFCDTGTVEPTISNWSNNYRVAPGFGLRITVPAMGPAPIALDFAFPVVYEPGRRSRNVQLLRRIRKIALYLAPGEYTGGKMDIAARLIPQYPRP